METDFLIFLDLHHLVSFHHDLLTPLSTRALIIERAFLSCYGHPACLTGLVHGRAPTPGPKPTTPSWDTAPLGIVSRRNTGLRDGHQMWPVPSEIRIRTLNQYPLRSAGSPSATKNVNENRPLKNQFLKSDQGRRQFPLPPISIPRKRILCPIRPSLRISILSFKLPAMVSSRICAGITRFP